MYSLIIRIVDLPVSVRAFTALDENDDYNMYINAKLSLEARAKAFNHEVDHIRAGHFYDYRPVIEKEKEVQKMGKAAQRTAR